MHENVGMSLSLCEYQLLPSPEEVAALLPIRPDQHAQILRGRQRVRAILHGKAQEKLFIVGPCSIHHLDEARVYAEQLHALQAQMQGALCIVMRAYFEKPRTLFGWKGLLYDPDLSGQSNLREGILQSRRCLLSLADLGVLAATEFLDPLTYYYLGDLVAWGCIGARTVASPIHRQMASLVECPIGCKNSPDGDLDAALHAILCARGPQEFLGMSPTGRIAQVSSKGNPDAHLVLRGGRDHTNWDASSIARALDQARLLGVTTSLLVDCSHDNSRKEYTRQPEIALDVVEQICRGNHGIAGVLIESNLEPGHQPVFVDVSERRPGVSVTDGCLGWDATQRLAIQTHLRLAKCAVNP